MTYSYINERARLTPQPDAKLSAMPKPSSSNGVEVPCMAYQQMQHYWSVINGVKGGTSEVRSQGSAYLPLEPFEKDSAYNRRKDRSCMAPWYTRLVRGLVGMVLRKPITTDGVSAEVKKHLENINLLGDDLSSFARDVFESAIDYGYTGIFVDYPRTAGVLTLAQQKESGDRPYWIHYSAEEIIGWRHQIIGNRRVFTQLRILQKDLESEGDFGEKEVERVKVYDLTGEGVRWRVFVRVKEEFELEDEGLLSLPLIPFAFVYTNKKKATVIKPPMVEVAYLNVKHYQLSSDLDHSLHISAHPKLVLYGYDTEGGDVVVGADEALVFDTHEGRAEWISPQIGCFEAQEKRIAATEEQMAVLGLSTLVSQKNVGESAEAKKLDRTQGDSIMAVIAQGLQDAFDLCLEYHAAYLNQAAGTCQVNRDFDVAELSPQAIAAFSNLHSHGQISLETLLGLLKKGEVFDDEFDIEAELERLESEFKRQSTTPKLLPGQFSEDDLDGDVIDVDAA